MNSDYHSQTCVVEGALNMCYLICWLLYFLCLQHTWRDETAKNQLSHNAPLITISNCMALGHESNKYFRLQIILNDFTKSHLLK